MDISAIINGLSWSVKKIYELIPNDRDWDTARLAIDTHLLHAQKSMDTIRALEQTKSSHFISLHNGRTDPNEDLEEWGTFGPIIGPCQISWTYGQLKIHTPPHWDDFEFLPEHDGMIEYNGIYYGDIEVWTAHDPLLSEISSQTPHRQRISADDFITYIRSKKK